MSTEVENLAMVGVLSWSICIGIVSFIYRLEEGWYSRSTRFRFSALPHPAERAWLQRFRVHRNLRWGMHLYEYSTAMAYETVYAAVVDELRKNGPFVTPATLVQGNSKTANLYFASFLIDVVPYLLYIYVSNASMLFFYNLWNFYWFFRAHER